MREINLQNLPFRGVAMGMIILGAAIVGVCAAAWVIAYFWNIYVVSMPFTKLIGGLLVVSLGYVILELELIRCTSKN